MMVMKNIFCRFVHYVDNQMFGLPLSIPWHRTPASSVWEHEKRPFIFLAHSISEDSSPVQCALPIRIGPDPCPKCARYNGVDPFQWEKEYK